jgi:two-component system chemotaxis response regulator CheY
MKRMMIVDDSLIIRRRIKRAHGMHEFSVVGSASDGQQALTLAKQTQPEIITIDLTMPNMDGTEAIPLLASICPEARILVISALADKATAIRALSGGAHGFLCKPFTDNELHQALVELISD